jgi:ketosteroid isomerase-like protein
MSCRRLRVHPSDRFVKDGSPPRSGGRSFWKEKAVSRNKQTVERYIDGFTRLDRAQILSRLTDDIEWTVFGAYRVIGKKAYDEHITEPGFSSPPTLQIVRLVEEDDVVMAEMSGEVRRDDGQVLRMAMGEVFVMRDGLIRERRAFVVPLAENDFK